MFVARNFPNQPQEVQEEQPEEAPVFKPDLMLKPMCGWNSTEMGLDSFMRLVSTRKVYPSISWTTSLSFCSSRASARRGPPQPAAM